MKILQGVLIGIIGLGLLAFYGVQQPRAPNPGNGLVSLVCDGATDNTATIQNALNTYHKGYTITLADQTQMGMPCMSSGLVIYSYTILDCRNLTLMQNPNTNANGFIQTFNFQNLTTHDQPYGEGSFTIRNCDLDGNSVAGNTTGNGVNIYGYQYLFENNRVHDFPEDGFYSEWSNTAGCPYVNGTTNVIRDGCMEATLRNNKFFHNGQWGMEWNGPHDSVIDVTWNFQNALNNGNAGGFRLLGGSPRIHTMHNYGDGGYEFAFNTGLDYGTDLYGEGGANAQFWIGAEVTIDWMIAANCPAYGVQLANTAAAGSLLRGGVCNLQYDVPQGPLGQMNLNTGSITGNPPRNVPNPAFGIYQNPYVVGPNCTTGIKSDSAGTFHC